MRVVVTGSEGLVGRALCRLLRGRGHRVRRFDARLGQSVLDRRALENACRGADALVHLAAVLEEDDPRLWAVNVEGTRNALEAAARARLKRVVVMSSCGVYGDAGGAVLDEESPLRPVTRYEKSKAEAEKIADTYQERVPVTLVRAPVVLGPSAYWERILWLATSGLPLVGSGENRWPVVYVGDLASALARVLEAPQAEGETYVVSGPPTTLRELVRALRRARGIQAEPFCAPVWLARALAPVLNAVLRALGKKPLLSGAYVTRMVRDRAFSTRKIEALGWRARVTMEEGVARTVRALEGKD